MTGKILTLHPEGKKGVNIDLDKTQAPTSSALRNEITKNILLLNI